MHNVNACTTLAAEGKRDTAMYTCLQFCSAKANGTPLFEEAEYHAEAEHRCSKKRNTAEALHRLKDVAIDARRAREIATQKASFRQVIRSPSIRDL